MWCEKNSRIDPSTIAESKSLILGKIKWKQPKCMQEIIHYKWRNTLSVDITQERKKRKKERERDK